MDYEAVIGLEVHIQLLTKTKIFCGCSTDFGAPPNTHVCPVCMGMPGVLPVLNKKVVEYAIKLGLAITSFILLCPVKLHIGFPSLSKTKSLFSTVCKIYFPKIRGLPE